MFEWITGLIRSAGYWGVAMLMFLENVAPPIPSELIMPLAGFVAARGGMNLWLTIVAGSVGSLAGAVLWYWVGRKVGEKRLRRFVGLHGKWVALTCADLDQAGDWFRRHGGTSVLIGRLVPGVRTFISVPAGLEGMPFGPFLLYSTAGTVLYTAALAFAGHILQENYEAVQDYLGAAAKIVLAGFLTGLIWRYYRQWQDRKANPHRWNGVREC